MASATCLVDAEPAAVFAYVRQPANHPAINGDGSVRGARFGPDEPVLGDRFGMRMKALGLPYRTTSKVVELEEGRRITWRPLADASGDGTSSPRALRTRVHGDVRHLNRRRPKTSAPTKHLANWWPT